MDGVDGEDAGRPQVNPASTATACGVHSPAVDRRERASSPVWGLLYEGGDAVAQVPAGGFSIGVVSRSRAKIGLALNYEAPLRWFDRGAITLGIGWLFDIDGSLREGRKGRRRGESGTTHAAPEEPPVLFTPDLTKD